MLEDQKPSYNYILISKNMSLETIFVNPAINFLFKKIQSTEFVFRAVVQNSWVIRHKFVNKSKRELRNNHLKLDFAY